MAPLQAFLDPCPPASELTVEKELEGTKKTVAFLKDLTQMYVRGEFQQYRLCPKIAHVFYWLGLGWAGLDWVGLGWSGLGWVGLGWFGLNWIGLGWAGLPYFVNFETFEK